ncbi:hypothetical protein, partial [Azospirillum sp. TSH100]|uniref:hypothetical protein n=1 Tax=Azospirillum sp. TSH100 TaxID=652764 RepID=UPI001B3B756A
MDKIAAAARSRRRRKRPGRQLALFQSPRLLTRGFEPGLLECEIGADDEDVALVAVCGDVGAELE